MHEVNSLRIKVARGEITCDDYKEILNGNRDYCNVACSRTIDMEFANYLSELDKAGYFVKISVQDEAAFNKKNKMISEILIE
ncbi:hypothetical protein [Methylomonas sp. AM2-LC]|uniref:hypothetical protein n=1 Tax=Methylomonas sp. AM2-LC TaxID=3153301 RepID=UPI003263F0C1